MLYLFSSNAQPQYAQDILNVLAAPLGHVLTFRYWSKWVDDATRERWSQLAGEDVLVHFSLQQRAQFFTPVIFPVRHARVISTDIEGEIHIVNFAVGSYVGLRKPVTEGEYPRAPDAYRAHLLNADIPVPYKSSASWREHSILEDPALHELLLRSGGTEPTAPSELAAFEATTEYLIRTETFANARFLMVRPPRDESNVALSPDKDTHVYNLTAGENYSLPVVQSQPHTVDATAILNVITDGSVVQLIGSGQLTISSSYDRQTVRLFASSADSYRVRHSTIALRPSDGMYAAQLDLPVEVRPSTGRTIGVAAGTTVGLVMLGLASILGATGAVAGVLVVGGALVASILNSFGISRKGL
jgi:hypothetical protein